MKCSMSGAANDREALALANRGKLVASCFSAANAMPSLLTSCKGRCRLPENPSPFFAKLQVIDFFHFLDLVGLSALLSTCSAWMFVFEGQRSAIDTSEGIVAKLPKGDLLISLVLLSH